MSMSIKTGFRFIFTLVLLCGIFCHERQAFALSPWGKSEKELSASGAEDRIVVALREQKRPDIFDVAELETGRGTSFDALARTASDIFQDEFEVFSSAQVEVFRRRLRLLLPPLYLALEHLFEQYEDTTLVFLGRDCNLIYDAARLFARGTAMEERIKLLPASMNLLYRVQSMGFREDGDRDLVRDYLALVGITEDAIRRREKFVFIDTGFKGSAAKMLMSVMEDVFSHLYGVMDMRSTRQFWSMFSSKLFLAGERAERDGLQLEFPDARIPLKSAVPEFENENLRMPDEVDALRNLNLMQTREAIGYGMQLFPRYSGTFENIARDAHGRVFFIASRQDQDINIDNVRVYNPEAYNPPAALMCQLLLADMVDEHLREGRYRAWRVRAAAIENDLELIEHAA